jgi:anti-sigma B factor antagonist
MQIEVGPESGLGRESRTCLVRVTGDLDLASTGALENELRRLMSSDQSVILDLEALRFIDSTGLGCLLRASEHSRANGGRLRMLNPTGQVKDLLELTQLRDVLPIM